MRNKICARLLVLFALSASSVFGQAPDYQIRLLLHRQHVPEGGSVGLSGWAVAPNLLAPGPAKGFVVGGLLFRGDRRWTEIMGGVLVDASGTRQPILDIRSYTSGSRLDGYVEGFYNTTTKKFVPSSNFTVALQPVGRLKIRVGLEAEAVFLGPEWNLISAEAGPRIVFPFPTGGTVSSVAVAYHHRIEGSGPENVVRVYTLLNFKSASRSK